MYILWLYVIFFWPKNVHIIKCAKTESTKKGNYATFTERIEALDKTLSLHAYPGKKPKLSELNDGADVFLKHNPAANGKTELISFESVKFPGYYLQAEMDDLVNRTMTLNNITSDKQKDQASFFQEYRVLLNQNTYRLFGHEYYFLCTENQPPYETFIGKDDDTKSFYETCSYSDLPVDQAAIDQAMKGEDDLNSYTAILLRKAFSQHQLGIVANKDQIARVGMPADMFKVIQPGLVGVDLSASFQSEKYSDYYLVRKGKDIYLQKTDQSAHFAQAASFTIESLLDEQGSYYIHPYQSQTYSLGYLHTPPFNVRVLLSNNTNEFDFDTTWKMEAKNILTANLHFNIFNHPELADKGNGLNSNPSDNTESLVNSEVMKLISDSKSTLSYDTAIRKAVQGKIDLKLLRNPSLIWHKLISGHVDHLLQDKKMFSSFEGDPYSNLMHDDLLHEKTESKYTEVHGEFTDWTACSKTCGDGIQYRTAACTNPLPTCTPLQEWQKCTLNPCEASIATVSYPIGTTFQSDTNYDTITKAIHPNPPVCPTVCLNDCNPNMCAMSCCSSNMRKKSIIFYKPNYSRIDRNIQRKILKRSMKKFYASNSIT
ncbi:uncharacterized protein LOC101235716 [Hydra vulgaris]|uniref:uncharacterized protein LOC101235716 n=1 Tax=Hydra vulgaris TaxID=6087 RepID=UPI0002B43363|nr:uncharacterized protein LOC101235716 [Hydra vulgaris]